MKMNRLVGRFQLFAILVTQCAWAHAVDPASRALEHGYRAVGEFNGGVTGPADKASGPTQVYAKVIEPQKKVALLSLQGSDRSEKAPYSVVTFQVKCHDAAVKYESVQWLDADWNPTRSGSPLPRTAWHRPAVNSPSEQALALACRR